MILSNLADGVRVRVQCKKTSLTKQKNHSRICNISRTRETVSEMTEIPSYTIAATLDALLLNGVSKVYESILCLLQPLESSFCHSLEIESSHSLPTLEFIRITHHQIQGRQTSFVENIQICVITFYLSEGTCDQQFYSTFKTDRRTSSTACRRFQIASSIEP